jgi:hypothetical protein
MCQNHPDNRVNSARRFILIARTIFAHAHRRAAQKMSANGKL